LADGSFIGHPPDAIPVAAGPPRHATLTPVRIAPDGTAVDTIATFESRLFKHDPDHPSGVTGYETSYAFRYAIIGNRIAGGNGTLDGLVVATIDGPATSPAFATTVAIDTVPLPGEPRPFTPELQAAYVDALRADYEARGSRFYEGSLESNMPDEFPDVAPRFVNVLGDDDGLVWLGQWDPAYGRLGAPIRYDVMNPVGEHLAGITLPTSAYPLWAGAGHLLLLETDSLDVQYVRLYRIDR
jgi:hypothetical protein